MFDHFKRSITYLRISVTDLCNLRCQYCMPLEGIKLKPRKEILSFEEITGFTEIALKNGVNKIRLTGGEPLVRHGVITLVGMLSALEGIEDFGLTTNGILLTQFASRLKEAGITRLNVSLDTLSPERYAETTRIGKLQEVLDGLKAADDAGFTQTKLNCVIRSSPNEPDALAVSDFAEKNGYAVQYIRQMNLKTGKFWSVIGGKGGHCATCNRLRLSSDGKVFPCLFSDKYYSVRELGYERAFQLAVQNKPESGVSSKSNEFYSIGG